MRVLVACEFSGIVRDAFLARGHDAFSCDLIPSESNVPGRHVPFDVLTLLREDHEWDLMIAHPPCTYLTNAGVRWLYCGGRGAERDTNRWRLMEESARFFNELLGSDIPRICVENPIMHSYGRSLVSSRPAQTIQPWMFGHGETKATCLWLSGLPKLTPSDIIKPDFDKFPRREQVSKATGEIKQGCGNGYATRIIGGGYQPRVHYASPGPERWKERSRTLTGIAAAMAEQWGSL